MKRLEVDLLSKLNNYLIALAYSSKAIVILGVIAFAEASIFPIPPDILLIPLILLKPKHAFKYALITTLFSVLGGGFGYLIGNLLYEEIGEPILLFYGDTSNFEAFSNRYNEFGGLAILIAGISPLPYKVITITSGATGLPLTTFFTYSIFARGIRFFAIAILLYLFGASLKPFIQKSLGVVTIIAILIVIVGFLLTTKL